MIRGGLRKTLALIAPLARKYSARSLVPRRGMGIGAADYRHRARPSTGLAQGVHGRLLPSGRGLPRWQRPNGDPVLRSHGWRWREIDAPHRWREDPPVFYSNNTARFRCAICKAKMTLPMCTSKCPLVYNRKTEKPSGRRTMAV